MWTKCIIMFFFKNNNNTHLVYCSDMRWRFIFLKRKIPRQATVPIWGNLSVVSLHILYFWSSECGYLLYWILCYCCCKGWNHFNNPLRAVPWGSALNRGTAAGRLLSHCQVVVPASFTCSLLVIEMQLIERVFALVIDSARQCIS